ncbi:MAG TPA: tRNA pseudouridine(55) synthase TruB, partial [Usitatibacter sp.]|nr:tRNA pseudouridine(55) synthase TruB [Usitatibacter sp.]
MKARNTGPDGVLLLDKPAGLTSTRALARAKRALGSMKGGHTGTLDPFATGLLPLVFGEATKFSRFLIDARKSYFATMRLGEETATGDTEAEVSARRPVNADIERIDGVLASFVGHQDQVPPMHSAVRIDGRRLY